jgi:murein DD-endopeptidase MepM/ murein hydrolase activator NlpD
MAVTGRAATAALLTMALMVPVVVFPAAGAAPTARAAPAAGTPVSAAQPTAAPATPPAGQGFELPVAPPPVVLTGFTAPANRYGPGHRGVDLAAARGSPVLAAGAGTVLFAGSVAGRGVVSVEHTGGLRTTYEPVQATVRPGDRVVAGQRIGTLQPGHPACAPATCLHWGARLPDRVYLDPMSLLGPWRVRLLPWAGR